MQRSRGRCRIGMLRAQGLVRERRVIEGSQGAHRAKHVALCWPQNLGFYCEKNEEPIDF